MEAWEKLLLANKSWAEQRTEYNKEYFLNLAKIQKPEFLWIGCSDSRVSADQITGTEPGEIFVHRNIANMVVHTDMNLLAVLQYSVEVLKVKHIIVCGHYGCGGVKAAIGTSSFGMLNKWLRNIKDVYADHKEELLAITDDEERTNRLVELNVREQLLNLAKTSIIQKSWLKEQRPMLHGWVYGLNNGIIKELERMDYDYPLDPVYRYDENALNDMI